MKLLIEKSVFNNVAEEKLQAAKGEERRELLRQYSSDLFGKDPDYAALERSLIDSLDRYGTDPAHNKFLKFLVTKNNANYGLDVEKADLLYHIFVNNESAVTTPAANFWLYNPKSYDGSTFKVKALALLGSPEAEKYGDKRKLKPIRDQIFNTTDDQDIEKLLTEWETRDSEDPKQKRQRSRSKTTNKSVTRSDVAQFIKDAIDSGEVKEGDFNSLVDYLSKED